MQGVKVDLLRDVECYTCGEEPSPVVMVRAARLENWETDVRRRGKEFVLVVLGEAYRHPDHDEGAQISTGTVVWFDRHRRWIRTHGWLYVLGQPAGEEIPIEGIDI